MIYLLIGLIILWASSELFVYSSCNLATEFKVPKYLIGVLITSLGTSLPELVLSIYGALTEHVSMVVGNIVGSNIANIAVGLGLLSLLAKKGYADDHLDSIKTDQNFLLLSTAFILVGSYMLEFSRPIAILALLVIVIFIKQQLIQNKKNAPSNGYNINVNYRRIILDLILVLVAAISIYFGSKWTILGGVELASYFNIPEMIIGLITIALGTSLPEIAVVVASCRKGETSLALGNIIGSNIYNVCFILGLTGLITPIRMDLNLLDPVIIYLVILTCVVSFLLKFITKRISGLLLLLSYTVFAVWSFY